MCKAEYTHVYPPTVNHFHLGACGSQKRVLDFLELDYRRHFLSWHVDAEN